MKLVLFYFIYFFAPLLKSQPKKVWILLVPLSASVEETKGREEMSGTARKTTYESSAAGVSGLRLKLEDDMQDQDVTGGPS